MFLHSSSDDTRACRPLEYLRQVLRVSSAGSAHPAVGAAARAVSAGARWPSRQPPAATMACLLLLTTSPFGLPAASLDAQMDCGSVSLCGVMTLETGKGPGTHRPAFRRHHQQPHNLARPRPGKYNHPTTSVHGIWPETGAYGTSKCIPPSVTSASLRASSSHAE